MTREQVSQIESKQSDVYELLGGSESIGKRYDVGYLYTADEHAAVLAALRDARPASERETQLREALVGALATIVALGLSGDRPQAERYDFAKREADALEAVLKRLYAADPPPSLETPR